MSNDLVKAVENLGKVEEGDVLVFMAGSDAPNAVSALLDIARRVCRNLHVTGIVIGKDDCIKRLRTEEMNALGWYRRLQP